MGHEVCPPGGFSSAGGTAREVVSALDPQGGSGLETRSAEYPSGSLTLRVEGSVRFDQIVTPQYEGCVSHRCTQSTGNVLYSRFMDPKHSPEKPDFAWYSAESRKQGLPPRCPIAHAELCPRYYESA